MKNYMMIKQRVADFAPGSRPHSTNYCHAGGNSA
jgi:hypothetical protein